MAQRRLAKAPDKNEIPQRSNPVSSSGMWKPSRRDMLCGLTLLPLTIATAPAHADDIQSARHILDEASITVEKVRDDTRKSGEMDGLLQEAKGALIIPRFYKAGFFFGGAYGDGVLLSRMPEGGFSDPAFYRMVAGSFGLQFGMQSSAIVFLILTEKGLNAVLEDEFKLGATAGIAIASLGMGVEGATTTHLGQDIVAYSTGFGLFAGGALEGALIRPRKDWNAAVYGVSNDDPRAITQRSGLHAALNLRDALTRNIYPTRAAPS